MKVTIVGFFAYNTEYNGGQEHKTRALSKALKAHYGQDAVIEVDTLRWKKHPFRLFFRLLKAGRSSDAVVMLPAHKGVRIFAPMLVYLKKRYGKKIIYDVVGGWLPSVVKEKPEFARQICQFDGIWVETSTMAASLKELGVQNVRVFPNFKELTPLPESELTCAAQSPLKLCTFSRVIREKGIEDAISIVRSINEERGSAVYTLDIYGRIDAGYQEAFSQLMATFPPYVRYRGCVDSDKSVEALKDYFALLFPTQYYTEGVPGTIIDAYASGVPVIAAKWENYTDVVEDGVTGQGYPFGDLAALRQLLMETAEQPEKLLSLKRNCLKKARDFSPEIVSGIIEALER